MIRIVPYHAIYLPGIGTLSEDISREYNTPTSHPDYKPALPEPYWVVLAGNHVIGTVGINKMEHYAVLKRMRLHQQYRGKANGVSHLMLQTVFDWCAQNGLKTIYLGTITLFIAAQKFYEQNGFVKIEARELPADFPNNPIDNLFYVIHFNNQ